MFLRQVKHRFERWLLGRETPAARPAEGDTFAAQTTTEHQQSQQERIRLFMAELEASSQEWLGKVRLINLGSIRQHFGSTWAKLEGRVELLAEKVIREEMTGDDKLLCLGGAEFLVFFAEATPEESRMRCLAIVEALHQKLFGLEDDVSGPSPRIAECHVIHRDDLALQWEGENSTKRGERPPFREEAEVLEADDVAGSTQIILDAIIARGAESRHLNELTPLLVRLNLLARSLKSLEPALDAARKSASIQRGGGSGEPADSGTRPLGIAWDDMKELISVLDVEPNYLHGDLLAALGRLQRSRQERVRWAAADEDLPVPRLGADQLDAIRFVYVPVFRSVWRGERIYKGIYRIERHIPSKRPASIPDDEVIGPSQEAIALETLTLERGVQCLSDRRLGAGFMLMVSLHAKTLRNPKSLRRISIILRATELRAKRRLLIEVTQFRESGDRISMGRAMDELRAHSQAVFVTVTHKDLSRLEKVAADCKKMGVHAIGVNLPQASGREKQAMAALARIASVGQQLPLATHVSSITSVPILAKAIACGVTYVCAPTLRPHLQAPEEPERTNLDDLYSLI